MFTRRYLTGYNSLLLRGRTKEGELIKMTKRVYLFAEGDKSMRDLLGGKGAKKNLTQRA